MTGIAVRALENAQAGAGIIHKISLQCLEIQRKHRHNNFKRDISREISGENASETAHD